MTIISPRPNYVEVSQEFFEHYLKTCPDYVRESYTGASRYKFRVADMEFADVILENGKEHIYIHPYIHRQEMAKTQTMEPLPSHLL